ncbi:MAG: response regulator transcription factor [Culicoidibacterales bacterium]
MHILICDDQLAVHESLKAYFLHENFTITSAFNGASCLDLLQSLEIDFIILDIMLPDIDGFQLCEKIRQFSQIPILFLSAKDQVENRLFGLQLGADDYVIKPFSPREVVQRVKTILRRIHPNDPDHFEIGDLVVHRHAYCVTVAKTKQVIEFTPKEFEVFLFLCEHQEQVISRNQLIEALWGYDYSSDLRSVDTLIKRLRLKLTAQTNKIQIRSVYGVGYQLQVLA